MTIDMQKIADKIKATCPDIKSAAKPKVIKDDKTNSVTIELPDDSIESLMYRVCELEKRLTKLEENQK